MKRTLHTVYRERAVLVGVIDRSALRTESERAASSLADIPGGRKRSFDPDDERLDELEQLASTAGATVVEKVLQHRERPSPATFIGSGKVDEIAAILKANDADVVIFDHDLSPAQVRNLEKAWGVKVLDRSELILDIFATHARTKQAKLQVELAQLEYTLPRLTGMWTHFSRQESGHGIGIGLRGPGEKQLEIDRRIARKKITALQREIREIEERKRREVEGRLGYFTAALVGYTNAGKSTLMNALTRADVVVENKLFSTLDTRTRVWTQRSGMKILLSDTVGFIRRLPHHLVSSFHATLEEVASADLLLHVVDASHPDAFRQIDAVNDVLRELGCDRQETLMLFNKIDALGDRLALAMLQSRHPRGVALSGLTGEGVSDLDHAVEEVMERTMERVRLDLPAGDGRTMAELAERGWILGKEYLDGRVIISARLPRREMYKYESFRCADGTSSPGVR